MLSERRGEMEREEKKEDDKRDVLDVFKRCSGDSQIEDAVFDADSLFHS